MSAEISMIIESYNQCEKYISDLDEKRKKISDQIKLFIKLRDKLIEQLKTIYIPPELKEQVDAVILMYEDLKKAADVMTGDNATNIYV